MKQYIIIRHSNGNYDSVDAQFDNLEDAINYAKLASMGNKGWTYEVFERHQ